MHSSNKYDLLTKLKVALRGMACDESVWYAQKVDIILG